MGTPDEVLFFDRVRKALDTREVYEEFLKLLHIFSKDIIDVRTLVERAELFLGDGDLFVEFKKLMAYEDPRFELGPPGSIRTGPPEQLSAPPMDDDLGPSYRRLPASVSYFLSALVAPDVLIEYPHCVGSALGVFGPR